MGYATIEEGVNMMNHSRYKVKLGKRMWFIRFVKSKDIPADRFGDSDGTLAAPQIRVRRSLRGQQMLDTIIHEALHASRPELAEEAVTQTATDVARLLWKIGYRQQGDQANVGNSRT